MVGVDSVTCGMNILKSGRHEVAEFAIMPYDSFLGEMARKQATGKPP